MNQSNKVYLKDEKLIILCAVSLVFPIYETQTILLFSLFVLRSSFSERNVIKQRKTSMFNTRVTKYPDDPTCLGVEKIFVFAPLPGFKFKMK